MLGASPPCARATLLLANRAAVLAEWGDAGLKEVAKHLSEDVRRTVIDEGLSPVAWVPETHLVAIAEAIFAGPAREDEDVYLRFVGRTLDVGFGRVRRVLVRFAPPDALFAKAPILWRHDHTHGELTVDVRDHAATVVLTHGTHLTSRIAALTAAESFRYALSLTRARDVTAHHALDERGVLTVELAWR